MEKLTDLLRHRANIAPDKTAYSFWRGGKWESMTWGEADARVDRIAAGLIFLGVRPGEALAIMGRTCLEWALCDLAVLRAGGVSVGIYQTLTGEQAAYILRDSGSRLLFVDDEEQLSKFSGLGSELPLVKNWVIWRGGKGADGPTPLAELEEQGRTFLAKDPECTRRTEAAIKPDDTALLIYTSGTTGPPKGAILTHGNILAQLAMLDILKELDSQDIMLFFLPLSHVGERIPGHFQRVYRGVPAAFVEDVARVLEYIREIRPTIFGSVPRIFEKAHAGILAQAEKASPAKRKVFRWAERVGRQRSRLERSGQSVPAGLRLKAALADRLVFRKIRDVFGGRVRFFISAAAPISVDILEFFHAAGMLVLEGYGMTEVSCFCTLNQPEEYRLGSVGKALPGIELRIAADGEVLVRGPTVCRGYLNQPELTRETITEDGWILTGDVGRLDEDGFLWITGRKKDIIITSGGKNVTPSNIEHLLCRHPLIEQALVHGDRRNYLTALIGISPDQALLWAERAGIRGATYEQLLGEPALEAEVQRAVDEANQHLAKYETVKRFALLPRLLEMEKGELTPTLKVRRNVVESHFGELLDSLYGR